MSDIQITIKNQAFELNSFPINQSIVLEFSEAVEDSYLDTYIHLVQALDSGSLIHIGDTYNQNVGLVRENFKPVDIDIKVVNQDPFQVNIKAKLPLTPGHSYQLLVQDALPTEHLQAIKSTSYSDSNITVVGVSGNTLGTHIVEVFKDSDFTNDKHIVTLKANNEIKSFNLKDSNEVKIGGLTLKLSGLVFVQGEMFVVDVAPTISKLRTSFVANLKVSSSKDITAIDSDYVFLNPSDIYNYNNVTTEEETPLTYTISVIGIGSFIVTFNREITDKLDFDNSSFKTREAFNMYTLSSLDLYNPLTEYMISHEILSNTEVEFTVRELI